MFIHHDASREVSCGMLTKVCRACINYLKLSCFLQYLLMKVIFGNKLCILKILTEVYIIGIVGLKCSHYVSSPQSIPSEGN